MLSEYETKAIKYLSQFEGNYVKTILNLITKLQKENEEKDKQIDLMAEYMEENMDEYQLDEIYAKEYNCNGMERNWTRGKEKEIKDIKQYFEKLAKEKDNTKM